MQMFWRQIGDSLFQWIRKHAQYFGTKYDNYPLTVVAILENLESIST